MSTDGNPSTENVQPPRQTSPVKLSGWKRARNLLGLKGRTTKQPTESESQSPPQPPTPPDPSPRLRELIQGDLREMRKEAKNLNSYNKRLNDDLKTLESVFQDIKGGGDETLRNKSLEETLKKFRNELMKVKLTIPSNIGAHKGKQLKEQFIKDRISGEKPKKIPVLHRSPLFEMSKEFKDFEDCYYKLGERLKLCLLCLSIFPQGAIIKKRLMLQWWVVEGFAEDEEVAEDYLKELMDKGFLIEAAPGDNSCRLHPFHRSVLVELAERARVFNFGKEGGPTQSFKQTFQACLSGSGLISYDDFKKKHDDSKIKNDDRKADEPIKVVNDLIGELKNLHLLMNVDEHILEFIDEWFEKMKNLNILYLGRWKAMMAHHIEVEDPKFFKKLGSLKYVKYFSLQGVSNIIELHNSILELTNLEVLDLRACANLEKIPERIEKLKKLKQLDMSECYLLAKMPKGLSSLKYLKVLKGFFVTEDKKGDDNKGCKIGDLHELKCLEKLCIYTDWKRFPMDKHVAEMEKLEPLKKLTITWGVGTNTGGDDNPGEEGEKEGKAKLPPKLEKLDLKCFPRKETPNWLMVKNLKNLKSLYIRGGKFRDLGQYQRFDDGGVTEEWEVERLRLKYLGEIEMEWRQLQELFPKLEYLEKVRCPSLTLFPCDAKGVWNRRDDTGPPAQEPEKKDTSNGQAEPAKGEAAAGPEPKEDGQKSQRPCCPVCC
ncbi:disease resistance RPP13-like protein 4 [Salvia hispanica]|uniref:disease resistance RPP13-like protein 4 n=1 Tax=Salvia hispanica TaxID=49212 RepID=UPI0020092AB2|nr:disease resistance RPP13-like protein 4 [Salvia hispanica]